jgi:hypothetical protein
MLTANRSGNRLAIGLGRVLALGMVRQYSPTKPRLLTGCFQNGLYRLNYYDEGVAITGVDFDLDGIRFNAIERGGTDPG